VVIEIIIFLLILVLLLLLVLFIRTFLFKPENTPQVRSQSVDFDQEHAIESMKAMLKFKTISYVDRKKQDMNQFEGFKSYLKSRYTHIVNHSEILEFKDTLIVFKVRGQDEKSPVVLMSHYDVVPVNGKWQHDPFLGEIVNGRIYGRGAIDTKGTLCAVMESVEHLLKNNHSFKQDLYLAYSGDEEIRGGSADGLVEYLEENNITPRFVLDEGGAVVSNIFPGVKKKAALIGLAEKGFMSVRMRATTDGGHASMPQKNTSITLLSDAVQTLNKKHPFKLRYTYPIKQMLTILPRHSKYFHIRFVFANLWLFSPLIKHLAKKNQGTFLALLKTTQAFTMMEGSEAINVLPTEVSVGINYRMINGEHSMDVVERYEKLINHPLISFDVEYVTEATPISKTDDAFDALKDAVYETWDNSVVSPYLMMAATDSRYYHRISEHVYRFSPMQMHLEERAMIHSVNESIKIDYLMECITFYHHLLKKL